MAIGAHFENRFRLNPLYLNLDLGAIRPAGAILNGSFGNFEKRGCDWRWKANRRIVEQTEGAFEVFPNASRKRVEREFQAGAFDD